MTAKEHYKIHLSNFYSWMIGDFEELKNSFADFCKTQGIVPRETKCAIDLGVGNGIQSFALAELGFKVKAIDFDKKLLSELMSRQTTEQIEIIEDDIRNLNQFKNDSPEIITCCGDTISHLESFQELEQLFTDAYDCLSGKGKIIISFRDYSLELFDTERFIPVKSDETKILTCIIEYLDKKIKVTDLLYEKQDSEWVQKVSSYFKLRLTYPIVHSQLELTGFKIISNSVTNGMHYLVGQKI